MRSLKIGAPALFATVVAAAGIAPAALGLAAYQSFHAVPGSPFKAAATPKGRNGANSISYSQSGKVAAISVIGAGRVSTYAVQSNNSLKATGHSIKIAQPISAQFNPKYALLAVYSLTGKVSIYNVGKGGSLKLAAGSPLKVAGGRGMAWNAAGTRLAATAGSNQIKLYSVSKSGAIKPLSSIADSGHPVSVSFSPFGARLAVANQTGKSVGLYNISSKGKLSRGPSYTLVGGASPYAVAYNPGVGGATNQIGVVGSKNAISMLKATANGLTLQSRVVTVPGDAPRAIAFTSAGQLALACNGNSTVSIWAVTSGGHIAERQALPVGKGVVALTYAHKGNVLAAASQTANTASVFAR